MKTYKIIFNGKIFARNLNLEQCMYLSAYLGKNGMSHKEIIEREDKQ